jgi:hypothetical protein
VRLHERMPFARIEMETTVRALQGSNLLLQPTVFARAICQTQKVSTGSHHQNHQHPFQPLRKCITDPISVTYQWKSPLPKGLTFVLQIASAHSPHRSSLAFRWQAEGTSSFEPLRLFPGRLSQGLSSFLERKFS